MRWAVLMLAVVATAIVSGFGRPTSAVTPSLPPRDGARRPGLSTTADIVIVGGGTAGCVMAARLCAARPTTKVILIERGSPRTAAQEEQVRALSRLASVWNNPSVVDGWLSTPNAGLGGRRVGLLTGATLGGSSTINAAQWTVPTGEYASTWGVAGLDDKAAGVAYAVAQGMIQPSPPPPNVSPVYTGAYIKAAASAGLPRVADPTNRSDVADGVWPNWLAADAGGRRRDSCSVYLEKVQRPGGACEGNLKLLQGMTATRVVLRRSATCRRRYRWLPKRWSGSRGHRRGCDRLVATGVELERSAALVSPSAGMQQRNGSDSSPPLAPGPTYYISARVQVVLAAGPYGSPKLLQLSGVGPPDVLAAARVQPVIELPVGRRVLIRPVGVVQTKYAGVPLAPSANSSAGTDPDEVAKWRAGGGGIVGIASTSTNGRIAAEAVYTTTGWRGIVSPRSVPLFYSYCFAAPSAFGSLSLDPANPVGAPLVADAKLLERPEQVAQMVRCLEASRAAAAAMPSPFVMTDVSPPPGVPVDEAYVRSTSQTAYHSVGGAAVGFVTDPYLRVRGVRRLRVVDASVIPFLPLTAGPVSSVYMLAEYVSRRLMSGEGEWDMGA